MTKNSDELGKQISDLDLEPIKFKLVKEDGWALNQVDEIEKQYKGFLFLIGTNPEEAIVPSKFIDKMWHAHILDTRKYAEDCDKLFGHFVHHYPYFGIKDEADKACLTEEFNKTKALFREVLNIDIEQTPSFSDLSLQFQSICTNDCKVEPMGITTRSSKDLLDASICTNDCKTEPFCSSPPPADINTTRYRPTRGEVVRLAAGNACQ